jgi:uncharacterized membrane protein
MSQENVNARLETFCDGVFAIALTLLVLELRTPVAESIHSSDELWHAFRHLLPAGMAFLLSFIIILITWVNHHAFMKLVDKSTPQFIYANGFLLLSVVLLPFPTALLAEFGFTNAAAPAVVMYSGVNLLTNIGWLLMVGAALGPKTLTRNEAARKETERLFKRALAALFIYVACMVLAFWFPLAVAILLTLIWVTWLIVGISVKEAET